MASQEQAQQLEEFRRQIRAIMVQRDALEAELRAASPPVGYAAIVSVGSDGSHKVYIDPISPGFPMFRLGLALRLASGGDLLTVDRLSTEQPPRHFVSEIPMESYMLVENSTRRCVVVRWFASEGTARKWASEILATHPIG